MGQLRGRTRDSSWQWLVIGVVLGLGCSGVTCLGLYALNYVRVTLPGQADASAPTVQSVLVVTATSGPTTPTSQPPAQVLTTTIPGTEGGPTAFFQQPTDANASPVAPAPTNGLVALPSPTLEGTAISLPTTQPSSTPTLAPI